MSTQYEGNSSPVSVSYPTYRQGEGETTTFSVTEAGALHRVYRHSTTQGLRDAGPSEVSYHEDATLPRTRTGSLPFDALFALALHEMRQDSVSQIADVAYNDGKPVPCDGFETGAKWHYVWTRDSAYAFDLGLGLLDPERACNSLMFKLSGFRAEVKATLDPTIKLRGEGRQIIQDTGSGGSWPISTDRVVWALGAKSVLAALSVEARAAFAPVAFEGLANTLDMDRLAAFDARDGLYTGEQSYLDWREQTYAKWITEDIVHIGTSKALSTNVLHYAAMKETASLAHELGHHEDAEKYAAWAADLKAAINRRFWLEDIGLYASLIASSGDDAPLYRFDMLGEALAILTGVADEACAVRIMRSYPVGPYGVPVYFPQQPDIPVYHNRSIWPFVTAYALKAAAKVGNIEAADSAVDSLMRGAALNLSNMENLEWLSGQSLLIDPDHPELAGPVTNSPRQLWSVGGYVGMVVGTIFGVEIDGTGISFAPFVTTHIHEVLGATSSAVLKALVYHGKTIDIELCFPEGTFTEKALFPVAKLTLNGNTISGRVKDADLGAANSVVVTFAPAVEGDRPLGIRKIEGGNPLDLKDRMVFAPVEPVVDTTVIRDGKAVVRFGHRDAGEGLTFAILRDGAVVAEDLVSPGEWTDPQPLPADKAVFYSVEARDTVSGHRSHRTKPIAIGVQRRYPIGTPGLSVIGGTQVEPDAVFPVRTVRDWGSPQDTVTLEELDLAHPGQIEICVLYNNVQHAINLGITNGVKRVRILDGAGAVVASGVVQMPHVAEEGTRRPLRESSPMRADLPAGTYSVEVSDFFNMSYLASNATFNAAGGVAGPVNRVTLAGLTVKER